MLMTDARPDSKPRSAFLPILLLVVGFVICAGMTVFVPLVDCDVCLGVGSLSGYEFTILNPTTPLDDARNLWSIICEWCDETGKTTLWTKLYKTPPKYIDLRGVFDDNLRYTTP